MIKVRFFQTEAGWQGFQVSGHAGAADPGEDIVCSAVSALAQTAALGLTKVLEIECDVKVTDGYLSCLLPELQQSLWEQAQLVLAVFLTGLEAIIAEEEYNKYVSVKEVPYRENEFTTFRYQKRRRKHKKW